MPHRDSDSPEPIVLAAGLRTPQAKAGGRFAGEDPAHLGSGLVRELLARNGLEGSEFDEVIFGCVGPPPDQLNVARVIALRAGMPARIPARTVARSCGSAIESVTSAMSSIRAGEGRAYLCGGAEVMSGYPLFMGPELGGLFRRLSRARSFGGRLEAWSSFRPRFLKPRVPLTEGLTDPLTGLMMGGTAELLAREYGISREESDAFALESHRRASRARDTGRFEREILPWLPLGAEDGARSMQHDDGIHDEKSLAGLAGRRPRFVKPDGTVTAGNSCRIADGATALIVATRSRARELGLEPLARIRAWAWAGLDPEQLGLGPVHATARVLEASGIELSDVGVIELNEAFAAQVLACGKAFASDDYGRRELGRSGALGELDPSRLNRNGGAIALGHPIGATGARLLLSCANELGEADCELGLVTLCIAGGMGGAVILERCEP